MLYVRMRTFDRSASPLRPIRGPAVALLLALLVTACAGPTPTGWRDLEPGLWFGEFASPRPEDPGTSIIGALRIDPRYFDLRLMNASDSETKRPLTAREWSRRHHLVAAINTSMYQEDYLKSVSLMRTRMHVNNPRLSRDRAVLAFDRLDDTVPPVQIIDRDCQDFDDLRQRYGTLVQSIRMISCDGRNVWRPQPNRWSTAAIGIDRQGRTLFIHVRAPYSTHDLINILMALPLDLKNAMYTEGGPEAQLYFRSGDDEIELVGGFETGSRGPDAPARAWPIPNVIGVVRRVDGEIPPARPEPAGSHGAGGGFFR